MKIIELKPIITENSLNLAQKGWYTFATQVGINKNALKKLIKEIFNVDVVDIKTLIVKGKTRRSYKTRELKKLSDWKKVIVKLKEGQKISAFEQTS